MALDMSSSLISLLAVGAVWVVSFVIPRWSAAESRRPRRSPKWFAGLAVALAALVVHAPSAAAHGLDDDGATNYVAKFLDSGAPGLKWQVFGGDALVELTNHTGTSVVVLGYEGEPYLLYTPGEGVMRNERSPATFLNDDRWANVAVPREASATADPVWELVASGDSYAWHDHRMHWMSFFPPAIVIADRQHEQLVFEWELPLLVGDPGRAVAAKGELLWIPPVVWWPPVVILGAVFAAVVALYAARRRPMDSEWRNVLRPLSVLVVLVLLANLVRVVDDMAAVRATFGEQLLLGALTFAAMSTVVVLTWKAWRGGVIGLVAAVAATALVVLWFGLPANSQLSASQIATTLPTWVRRWTVAASIAVLLPGLVASGLVAVNYLRSHGGSTRKKEALS